MSFTPSNVAQKTLNDSFILLLALSSGIKDGLQDSIFATADERYLLSVFLHLKRSINKFRHNIQSLGLSYTNPISETL